jgi:hypothetical protein
MSKQRGKPEQRERQAAPGHHDKTRQRKSIAGGRWRSGSHNSVGLQAVLSNPTILDTDRISQ